MVDKFVPILLFCCASLKVEEREVRKVGLAG
jgi:hypothetical protein